MTHSQTVIALDRPTLLVIGQPDCHLGTTAEGKRGPARSPRKYHCICAYWSVITHSSGSPMRSACVPENWVACGKSTVTIKPILQVTLRQLHLTNNRVSVRFTLSKIADMRPFALQEASITTHFSQPLLSGLIPPESGMDSRLYFFFNRSHASGSGSRVLVVSSQS